MKIVRYQALIGPGVILLFCINVFLAAGSLIFNSTLLAVLTISLVVIQLFIHRRLAKDLKRRQRNPAGTTYSFGTSNQSLLFEEEIDRTEKLLSAEKQLIKKRSENKPAANLVVKLAPQALMSGTPLEAEKLVALLERDLKVHIGTSQCSAPYDISVLNAGLSFYNTCSPKAIFSLVEGAKIGEFTVATGRNGILPEHIRGGADLIWQFSISTSAATDFSGSELETDFKRHATRPYVKMVELFLTDESDDMMEDCKQDEYSKDRSSQVNKLVQSLKLIKTLRADSGGKPAGIRMQFNRLDEVTALCQLIKNTRIVPDFITVDQEYYSGGSCAETFDSAQVLTALRDQMALYNIPAAIIYSGKIGTEYEILKALSLGASVCISTSAMAYASKGAGGLLSQNVYSASMRVANFHRNTVTAVSELLNEVLSHSFQNLEPQHFEAPISFNNNPLALRKMKPLRSDNSFPPIIYN